MGSFSVCPFLCNPLKDKMQPCVLTRSLNLPPLVG